MLKHALSANNGLTNGGVHRHHVSQDPRGYTDVRMTELPPNGIVRTYRSPPHGLNQTYAGHTSLNLSTASTNLHSRSFNLGNNNPYSNTSTLSNSKHSIGGGTSASVSPLGAAPHSLPNGGLHIPRQGIAPPPPASFVDGTPRHPPIHHHPHHPYANTTGLNVSVLSASKHSLGGNSSSVSPLGMASLSGGRVPNGGLNISRVTVPSVGPPAPMSPSMVGGGGKSTVDGSVGSATTGGKEPGVREMLTSLGLLCLVSLLLALLSLVFMLKISPVTAADVKDFLRADQVTVISPEEYVLVYEVTLALCALSLSLNLCCLLVCSVQFLFAVKLVRDSPNGERTNKYLKKSSFTRVCAVGGFFVSIPVFLTGIILYTFIQFHSTPAVITSALIGLGIIFCGCAMVHNVFIWQKEKTNAVRAMAQQQRLALQRQQSLADQSRLGAHTSFIHNSGSTSSGQVQHQTLDLSTDTPTPPEICTLV